MANLFDKPFTVVPCKRGFVIRTGTAIQYTATDPVEMYAFRDHEDLLLFLEGEVDTLEYDDLDKMLDPKAVEALR